MRIVFHCPIVLNYSTFVILEEKNSPFKLLNVSAIINIILTVRLMHLNLIISSTSPLDY